jgi:hypothetical protein
MRQISKGLLNCIKSPRDGFFMLENALRIRLSGYADSRKIVIGTHHKVLTVFFSRIFKTYAALLGKRLSLSTGHSLDYSADIIFDHHSKIDFSRIQDDYWGFHTRRDPRDLLVSSAFYHLKAKEPWLHKKNKHLGGKSYQEYLRSLNNIEDVLLFEIDHAAGKNIKDMHEWNYNLPKITEFRYEEIVSEGGEDKFYSELARMSLPNPEISLLRHLFASYSLSGPWVKKKHLRNPSPNQWNKFFTAKISDKFNSTFPHVLHTLGYYGIHYVQKKTTLPEVQIV